MNHIYLILAHNEFEVLKSLIFNLDDLRNTIIIHFDKKVKTLPNIETRFSKIIVLDKRYNLSWGHSSIIRAEILLLEHALRHSNAQYYHIISGVHLPLRSQNEIHDYFEKLSKYSVFKHMDSNNYELNYKMRYYHFLIPLAYHNVKILSIVFSRINNLLIWAQKLVNFNRHKNVEFKKASQWCSLNRASAEYLVTNKVNILKKYNLTFCADEIYKITELMNHAIFKEQITFDNNILYTDFENSSPKILNSSYFERLINSKFLYARKFSDSSFEIVKMISNNNCNNGK